MTSFDRPVPVRPVYPEPRQALVRAAYAIFAAALYPGGLAPAAIARDRHFGDVAVSIIERAAVAGGTTTGWGAPLVAEVLSAFFAEIASASAAAQLMPRGLRVDLEGSGSVSVRLPAFDDPPTTAGWVGEGFAIPVRRDAFATQPAGPVKKLAVIVTMSRELSRLSAAEAIFAARLRAIAGISLDAAYFSASPASSIAAAGLLFGLSPIAAPGPILETLAALGAAVSANGSGDVAYIAPPSLVAEARVRLPPGHSLTLLSSRALPAGRVIAVDPAGLIHLTAGLPDLDAGEEAAVMLDTEPTDIGVPGSPAVAGAPTQSMFQSAQTSLRMLLAVGFSARPGAVAFADGIDWSAP